MPKRTPIIRSTLATVDFDLQSSRTATMHEFVEVLVRVEFTIDPGYPGNYSEPPESPSIEFIRVIALEDAACVSALCDGQIVEGEDLMPRMSVRDFDNLDSTVWDIQAQRMRESNE